MDTKKLKFIAVAVMFLSLMSVSASASVSGTETGNWMRSNNVLLRLVTLDRADGFFSAISITGPGMPSLLIAPGLQKRWLVQIDGAEAILKQFPDGSLQLIAADEDTELFICRLKIFTSFLLSLRNCELEDRLCRVDKFLNLLIGWNACIPPDED